MIFLVLSGNMIFLFPKNMILLPDGKWKMTFLKKKYTEIWNFLKMFWKDVLFKKYRAGTWSFLYYLERWYFFPKTWYFFPESKTREEWPFSRDTRKHDIFYLICFTSPCKNKNQRRSYPEKIHLKRIGISDRHLKKGSSKSLYLHGDLYWRFHILQFSKKKPQGNLIYRIEVWLLLQFMWSEIFCNE